MPSLSSLPGEIPLPSREELQAQYKRDYLNRDEDGDIEDPQIVIDAAVTSDSLLPIYSNQRILGSNGVLEDAVGEALLQWGKRYGVGPPLAASGSSGFIIISASVGGTTISDSQTLVDQDTGLGYRAVVSDIGGTHLFLDGEYCAVEATSAGPETNVAGGHALTWSVSSSGSGPTAIVATNADGSGLTDGRDVETEPEYRERIREAAANPAQSGNDADYRTTTTKTPGIRIQQVFTYPKILGTGSTAVVATLAPSQAGGSRVPNEAQRGLIELYVTGDTQMPGDDSSFFPVLTEQSVDISYKVSWTSQAAGWADLNPWPQFALPAGTPGPVIVASAADATHFVLSSTSYTNIVQPVVGQTVAFYNQAGGAFAKKRILTVTGSGPWTIVADTTNNSSDTSYVPIVGQRAMPWSNSLPAILPTLKKYFDSLGPGEMTSTFYDEGRGLRRSPRAPKTWPNILTTKGLEDAIEVDQIHDRQPMEGPGISTTVGTPGVLAYQIRLRWVSLFPL